jgi:hypothetical protein
MANMILFLLSLYPFSLPHYFHQQSFIFDVLSNLPCSQFFITATIWSFRQNGSVLIAYTSPSFSSKVSAVIPLPFIPA